MPGRPGHAEGAVRGAAGDGTPGRRCCREPTPRCAAPAAHATGRQRRDGSEPVGNSSSTNTTNPTPRKYSQPSWWPQARVAGKCSSRSRQLPAIAYDAPVAAQQPADGVRRALPHQQRADGGETPDEHHPTAPFADVSRTGRQRRRQRVQVVVDQRGRCKPPGSAPRCSERSQNAARGVMVRPGDRLLASGVRRHFSPLTVIISPGCGGQKGASRRPSEGQYQVRGEASITGARRGGLPGLPGRVLGGRGAHVLRQPGA